MVADERQVLVELEDVLDSLGVDILGEDVVVEDELDLVVVFSRQYPSFGEHSEPSGQPSYLSVFPKIYRVSIC